MSKNGYSYCPKCGALLLYHKDRKCYWCIECEAKFREDSSELNFEWRIASLEGQLRELERKLGMR